MLLHTTTCLKPKSLKFDTRMSTITAVRQYPIRHKPACDKNSTRHNPAFENIPLWQKFVAKVTKVIQLTTLWWQCNLHATVQLYKIYTVSHKNTPDIFSCNLNKHFLISIIFSTNIIYSLGYWNMVYFPTSPKQCFCTTLQNKQTQK